MISSFSRSRTKLRLASSCSAYAIAAIMAAASAGLGESAKAQTREASPTAGSARTRAAQANAANSSETIVVTARRISESASKVPLTVVALGSRQLASRSITSQTDLQRTVPGLTIRTGQNNNAFNYSIRGQSLDLYSGSQPGVLPYLNDVQLTPFGLSNFYDLSSVQVLKGPQGTLFGRNATGGAVLYSTAKPTNDFSGFITAKAGNYDFADVEGALNVPIIPDKVLLRVAGDFARRDGYQHDVFTNSDNGRVLRESGRASLTVKPVDGVENRTVFQYDHSGGNDLELETWSVYPCGNKGTASLAGCFFGPALDRSIGFPGAYNIYRSLHPGSQPGGILQQQQYQHDILGPYQVDTFQPSTHNSHDFQATNTTSVEINGDLTFKNIIGGSKSRTYDNYDPVGSGPYFLQGQDSDPNINYAGKYQGFTEARDQYSEEAQFLGKALGGTMNYVVGGYYAYQNDLFLVPVSFFEVQPFIPKTVQSDDFTTIDKTEAIYGQATQDLSRWTGITGLKLTGGVRYTWEQQDLTQGDLSTVVVDKQYLAAINPAARSEHTAYSNPSWTVGLDWQYSPELLLYVTQRGSWRSGGINGTGPARTGSAAVGGNIYLPETTYDVEVGAKYNGNVAQMPVHVNVSAYNQWVLDVQRVTYEETPAEFAVAGQPALQALTVNIPQAIIRGVEVDGNVRPTSWLEVGATVSYTDAQYSKGNTTLFGSPLHYGPYGDTPRWTGDVYVSSTLPVPENWGSMVLRGDVYAQTGQFFSSLAGTLTPDTLIPGYALVNLRFDWNVPHTRLTLSGFGKNILNHTNYTGGIALIPFGINGVATGEPATFGFEGTYRF